MASAPKGEGLTIEYKGGVTNADGTKGTILNQQNLVRSFQKVYQVRDEFYELLYHMYSFNQLKQFNGTIP